MLSLFWFFLALVLRGRCEVVSKFIVPDCAGERDHNEWGAIHVADWVLFSISATDNLTENANQYDHVDRDDYRDHSNYADHTDPSDHINLVDHADAADQSIHTDHTDHAVHAWWVVGWVDG